MMIAMGLKKQTWSKTVRSNWLGKVRLWRLGHGSCVTQHSGYADASDRRDDG